MYKTAIVAVLCLILPAAMAGAAPYTYLERFDDDTDTYTPPTNYGGTVPPVATGSPPAHWVDKRSTSSFQSGLIEEVTNGYDGVSAGPAGGANFAMVHAGSNNLIPGSPTFEPGTRSFQLDFYTDPRTPAVSGFLAEMLARSVRADGSTQSLVYTDLGVYTNTDPDTGQLEFGLWIFRGDTSGDSPNFARLPYVAAWYTYEVIYGASDVVDPGTGALQVGETVNIYRQANFVNAELRAGDLVATIQHVRDSTVGASMQAAAMFLNSGIDFERRQSYVDNAAFGPLIVPESGAGLMILLSSLIALAIRRSSVRRRPSPLS